MSVRIGDIVYYTNLGDRDGVFPVTVQAAIVTGVLDNENVSLLVFYKTGFFQIGLCMRSEFLAGSEEARGKWSPR